MNNTSSIAPYYQQLHDFANAGSETYYPNTRNPAEQSTANAADNANLYSSLSSELSAAQNVIAETRKPQLQQRRLQHIDGTLLEAVTSAAGEQIALEQHRNESEEHHQSFPHTGEMDRQRRTAEQAVSLLPAIAGASTGVNKRKRASPSPSDEGAAQAGKNNNLRFKNYGPRKRRRRDSSPDGTITEFTTAVPSNDSNESFGARAAPASDAEDTSFFVNEYPPSSSLTDARAAGVYSAAALFRKPTSSSKKYTRPPMSKLFSSLQLSPENFIRLQALAKTYMLNPAYPDRQSCVGNRGKGETDMVKLRLYNCVKEFLDEDGVGTRFFGPDSEGRDARVWEWPRDVNRAVSLCTPLLRRMVTNERQRQYAVETRKGAVVETENAGIINKKATGGANRVIGADRIVGDAAASDISRLGTLMANHGDDTTTDTHTGTDNGTTPAEMPSFTLQPPIADPPLTLRFCVLRTDAQTGRQQLLGHYDVVGEECLDFGIVASVVTAAASLSSTSMAEDRGFADVGVSGRGEASGRSRISVWLAGGLVPVTDAQGWRRSVAEVEGTVWMEGVLRVVIEVA